MIYFSKKILMAKNNKNACLHIQPWFDHSANSEKPLFPIPACTISYFNLLLSAIQSIVYSIVDILFLSNHKVHKSSCRHCFWAPDPLIHRFLLKSINLRVSSPKTNTKQTFMNVVILTKKYIYFGVLPDSLGGQFFGSNRVSLAFFMAMVFLTGVWLRS